MKTHNIINISYINIKKWFNNINNEMADLLFKKCYEFKFKKANIKTKWKKY